MFHKSGQRPGRSLLTAMLSVAIAVFVSGCYTTSAVRDYNSGAGAPWWCKGTPDLTQSECLNFSLQLDVAVQDANKYPTVADFAATGATAIGTWPGNIGVPYGTVTSTFNTNKPNVLLYAGNLPASRLTVVAWVIDEGSVVPPEGFPGSRDVWTAGSGTEWWLTGWVIRGHQNHPNVFCSIAPLHDINRLDSGQYYRRLLSRVPSRAL